MGCGNFGHSSINKHYIAYFSLQNGHLSTSGLKSDVTILFLDPDFFLDVKISVIRPQINVQNDHISNSSQNLMLPSCCSTLISYKTRKFWRFRH